MDVDEIWRLADLALDDKLDERKQNNTCRHDIFSKLDGYLVCDLCGGIIGIDQFNGMEWNNYKDDSGNYSKNTRK